MLEDGRVLLLRCSFSLLYFFVYQKRKNFYFLRVFGKARLVGRIVVEVAQRPIIVLGVPNDEFTL